ncbi:MAG: hypothetical protein DCC49_10770, partial [Acidobacteria bacterium]
MPGAALGLAAAERHMTALVERGRREVRMLRRILFFSVVFGILALPSPVSSASIQTQAAVDWIVAQQQNDGGFEMAGFPGFETPDAILAIAENAQTETAWSSTAARAAVEAIQFGGGGPSPLDAIDDLAESTPTAGLAAKLIVLNVLPLGLDANDFDPSGDSPDPTNLVLALDAGCGANTASFGFLADTLYAAMAKKLLCGSAPPAAVATIKAAQQSNGGWGWSGDPNGTDLDVDMTSLAIQALVAAGVDLSDTALVGGLEMLARGVKADGSWEAFGNSDPNSTSMGILALRAAGYDPADQCWRDLYAPERAGAGYGDPAAWLISQQQSGGRIASPSDGWGINTIATSQTVRALGAAWTPVVRNTAKACPVSTEFLAEGSTGPGFETWVLIANPSETETIVARTSFLTGAAPVSGGAVQIAPLSRCSIKVNDFVTDWNVSTRVDGLNGPVVAERAVYSTGAGRVGAHLGQGLGGPANDWFLTEGSTGPGFETWILVANPEALTAEVKVGLLTGSGPGPEIVFSLAPGTRRSVRVNDYVTDWGVSARVVSTGAGVVAERATYVSGDLRRGATDSPGTPAGSNDWFLAEGSTGPGFETWILVANPDTITADVTVGFITG